MEKTDNIIGKNIKRLRAAKGVAQKEFARTVGVHVKTLSEWENGHRELRRANLEAVMKALGCTREDLYIAAETSDDDSGSDLDKLFRRAVSTLATLNENQLRLVLRQIETVAKVRSNATIKKQKGLG